MSTQEVTPASLQRAEADIKQYSIDQEPIRWSGAHLLLSQKYAAEAVASSGPTQAADKGIKHIGEALKVITEENNPQSFIMAQFGLVCMYLRRAAGNRAENLTKALVAAKSALRVYKDPLCPNNFVAELYALIGRIYADVGFEPSSSRAANEDLAIRHYLASLQRCPMDVDSGNWAERQLKVGKIYNERKNGDRRSNMKVAIKHWLEALKVFTKSQHRDDWAKTHYYLGLSYEELLRTSAQAAKFATMPDEKFAMEMSNLVEKSIASCTNALQVYSTTNDPASW
jgi:tetratricopeptide (TPR) repeat protein